MDKKLINFRTPIDLQKTFDLVCCYKSQTRTQVLIELMRQFIETHHPLIIKQVTALKDINNNLSEIINPNSNSRSYVPIQKTEIERDNWESDEIDYSYPFYRGEIR